MPGKLSSDQWNVFQYVSEAYALTSSPTALDAAAFNRLVRRRIPARGARFAHDHHDTCAYIARSKNLNVVAYTANLVVPLSGDKAGEAGAAAAAGGEDPYRLHEHYAAALKHSKPPEGFSRVASGCAMNGTCDVEHPIHAYFIRLEPSYVASRRKKGDLTDCDELTFLQRKFAYDCKSTVLDCATQLTQQQLLSHLKNTQGSLALALSSPALPPAVATGAAAAEGGGTAAAAQSPEALNALLASLQSWWTYFNPIAIHFVALPEWPAFLLTLPPLSSPPESSGGEAGNEGDKSTESPPSWCSDADTVPVILAIIDQKLSVLEKVYVKSIERWMRLPTVEYIEVFGVSLADGKETYEKKSNDGSKQGPKNVTKEELEEMANS